MKITCERDLQSLSDGNLFLGEFPILKNTNISINGRDNILFCEKNVCIENSNLSFSGNNSVIYLCSNRHSYKLNVSTFNNSALFIGCNNYFNGTLNIILSEEKHVYIGDDGLFSVGIWLRIADPHLIYDVETKKRKNPTASIFIGDHVWIGQSAMLLKGTQISSGSIIGGMSVVSGKHIVSNESWAGNPVRKISENIFWKGDCVHNWTTPKTQQNEYAYIEDFIYQYTSEEYIAFSSIDHELSNCQTARAKINYLSQLNETKTKNRFALKKAKRSTHSLLNKFLNSNMDKLN